jgi:DNA-binding NarL/FixJ family response regulator
MKFGNTFMSKAITIVSIDIWKGHHALKQILSTDPSLELVGEYDDEQSGILGVIETQPDIILVSWDLRNVCGYELIDLFRQICPSAKVLIVEDGLTVELLREALLAGARFFLPRNSPQTITIIKDNAALSPSQVSALESIKITKD